MRLVYNGNAGSYVTIGAFGFEAGEPREVPDAIAKNLLGMPHLGLAKAEEDAKPKRKVKGLSDE